MLKQCGIDAERVAFVGYRPRQSYLELFQRIDISLDTDRVFVGRPLHCIELTLQGIWIGRKMGAERLNH